MEYIVSRDGKVELENILIQQRQIPGQHLGAVKLPYKISEEGNKVDTDRE